MSHCITDNHYYKDAGEKPKGIGEGKVITSVQAKVLANRNEAVRPNKQSLLLLAITSSYRQRGTIQTQCQVMQGENQCMYFASKSVSGGML